MPAVFSDAEGLAARLPDDAFYYFEPAQRLVAGEGLTFDGEDRADGFQPLYMALILPFATLPGVAFVRSVLALNIALHLLTLGLIGRFAWRATSSSATSSSALALLAAAVYALNTWGALSSVNGLETALATCLFALSLVLVAEWSEGGEERRGGAGWAVAVGVAVALLFLARTDQIFYCGALLAFTLWRAEQRVRWTVTVGAAGMAVALPWVVWHWVSTGALVPSSGVAQPLILRTLAEVDGRSFHELGWVSLRGFFDGRVFGFTGFDRYVVGPALLGSWLAIAVAWSGATATKRRLTVLIAGSWVAGFALAFVHTYLRWYPRTWYFDQYILLTGVNLALGADAARRSAVGMADRFLSWSRRTTFLWATVLIAAVAAPPLALSARGAARAVSSGTYPHQLPHYRLARWLEPRLPPDASIGSWNAGIRAFFSERPVVNLDGAISATTVPYLERRNLTELLCERGVDYVVDGAGEFERFQPFLPRWSSLASAPPLELPAEFEGILVQPLDPDGPACEGLGQASGPPRPAAGARASE